MTGRDAERVWRGAMGYLMTRGISREAAEDLAQEAVLRVLQGPGARNPHVLGRFAGRSVFVDNCRAERAICRTFRPADPAGWTHLFGPEVSVQIRQAIRRLGDRCPQYTRAIEELLHGEPVPTDRHGRDSAHKLRHRALQALREVTT